MCPDDDNDRPTHDEIAEYFQGGLGVTKRARIAAYLLRHPKAAREAKRVMAIETELRKLFDKQLDWPMSPKLKAFLEKVLRD